MANVYKISKDPRGLFKKTSKYFFHKHASYEPLHVPDDDEGITKNPIADSMHTRDFDDLVGIINSLDEDTSNENQSNNTSENDTVIIDVQNDAQIDNLKIDHASTELDDTDKILLSTFGVEEANNNSSGKHIFSKKQKKSRDKNIKTTIELDEDIRKIFSSDPSASENEPSYLEDDKKSTTGEIDHGPLETNDEFLENDEENPYEVTDFDDNAEDKEDEILAEEFLEQDEAEYFIAGFRKKLISNTFFALGALISFLALLYLESFSFMPSIPRPNFLKPDNFRLVLALVDIQLLVISAAFVYESFLNGIKALFSLKPNRDSITACVILVCLVHAILMCFFSTSLSIMLFSSVGAFCALISAFQVTMEQKRNLYTFGVLACENDKFVASKVIGKSGELDELGEFLPEDPDIFTISKTKFVDDAIKNIKSSPRSEQNYKILIPVVIFSSIIFSIISFISYKDLTKAINCFTIMSLISLPLSSLFSVVFPYLIESAKIARKGGAMIGGNSFEEYSTASVISFNDIEVFPARGVKVTSVRTYGEHRIDHTILYAARIFSTVGGPLAPVFENSIKNAVDVIAPVDILTIEPDGISATVDGIDVFIGKKSFMLAYNFGFVKDSIDDTFENSVGRIMYMTIGDNIAAKFYIKYSINQNFEKMLNSIAKIGICVGIKSCDPSIDESLLNKLLHRKEYPVRIIKSDKPLSTNEIDERKSSGIVCASSVFNMLRTFLACDRTAKAVSFNIIAKFISLFLGIAIVIFLFVANGGNISGMSPWFIILYQFFWLLPTIATSLLG